MSPSQPTSLLDIVQVCDNFSLTHPSRGSDQLAAIFRSEPLIPWRLSPDPNSPALGLLRPRVIEELRKELVRKNGDEKWVFTERRNEVDGRVEVTQVSFVASLDTPRKRSEVMRELCERWRDEGIFPEQISPKKWRGEMYPVYRNPFGPMDAPPPPPEGSNTSLGGEDIEEDDRNYAFEMERAACSVFGVVTYGVHMTIYHEDTEGEDGAVAPLRIGKEDRCRIWVPRRAKTKQTWPGKYDNTVAGGIPSGMSVFESIVKESMEEASIEEGLVRKYAQAVGSVSYFYRTTGGWLQPEVEYIYDICIPPGVSFQPQPLDGEVESFECLTLAEVTTKMLAREFKPNCAIVLLDFMVRKGYITPDTEPNYLEISTRLHGRFDYDRW